MDAHRALAHHLRRLGVDHLFGLIGEANMFVADAFFATGGTYVAHPREDGAVLAAMGYAYATDGLGVATVTHGPGLTNTVTALTEAARNHVPLLLLVGDTDPSVSGQLQDIDQHLVSLPTGCGFVPLRRADRLAEDLGDAVRRCLGDRRPVLLNLPVDVLAGNAATDGPSLPVAPRPTTPDDDALDAAVGVAASANRPLVLAGRGVVSAGARRPVLELAHRLGAPVATTLQAKGLFAGDDGDLGVLGTLASPLALDVAGDADCLLTFGASLNRYTTDQGTLLGGKKVVQVDTDPAAFDRWFPADVRVLGDAAAAATEMTRWLQQVDQPPSGFRSPALTERIIDQDASKEFDDASTDITVDLRSATLALDTLLPWDRDVVTDVGRYVMAPLRFLSVTYPSSLFAPLGFGAVGMGLGTAIGVAVARPDTPTVAAIGDGGLMMSLAELHTAVRYDLDLIVVLYNDGSYSAEYHHFTHAGMDPGLSLLPWPDFAPLAEAMGCRAVTVRRLDDLKAAGRAIEERTTPLVIDLRIDPAIKIGFYD